MAKVKAYNVIRRDFFGDPGKQVGANLTKERAEEYVKEMQGCERATFEIIPAGFIEVPDDTTKGGN